MEFIAIYAGLALAISLCLSESEPQSSRLKAADVNSASPDFDSTAIYRGLINNYCVACHDGTNEAVGLNLDALNVVNVSENAEVWEKVVHKLRTGDMPPPDKTQPTTQERRALLSWLAT